MIERPLSRVLAGLGPSLDAMPVRSVAASTQVDLRAAILSPIWAEVNAWGGTHDPADPAAAVRAEVIDRVLDLLEAHGARDPLTLPHSQPTRSAA